MSEFLDKAKEAADDVKDKVEGLVHKAGDDVPEDTEEKSRGLLAKMKGAVEGVLPGHHHTDNA